jgi:sporulation protein YlmC with PRC-barrel domain
MCSVSTDDENNKKMCNVVLDVVQKQGELIGNLQNQVLELTKASITTAALNHSNNTNTNSNNKIKNKTMGNTNNNHLNNCGNFNINIFLNEQCKDAINLSDFVKSLEITFENLKIVNQTGMEESVSALILKGLENMDASKRPIHCTDQKRDVMYVKEEEKWEKDEGNDKLKSSIDDISRRHAYTLKKFKDVNPDIKVGHAMHDDFIQTMNRICTPIEDPGKKRIVKQVGKNVAMNAAIANENCDESASLMQ